MKVNVGQLHFNQAHQRRQLPVVYSRAEIVAILKQLKGVYRLMVELMYGTGVRKAELLSLRIKDIDFDSNLIIVRSGKGDKDRRSDWSRPSDGRLSTSKDFTSKTWKTDMGRFLPDALHRKYPSAATETAWRFLFPSSRVGQNPRTGTLRRHHLHPTALSKQIRCAVKAAGVNKPARSHQCCSL